MEMPTSVSPVRTGRRMQAAHDDGEKLHVRYAVLDAMAWSETIRPSIIWIVASGAAGDGRIVGDQHQRHVPLAVEPDDEIENVVGVFAVEIARGFVGEQHGGAVGKAAGDGDALAFSTGKFGRKMIEAMLQSDGF